MKTSSGFAIIVLCLILVGLTGISAADPVQYDKSVSIHLNIDNGVVTTGSVKIFYGSAPNLFPATEGFKGELLAADGSVVKTFTLWDPRIQFGDGIVTDSEGSRIQPIVDRQNSANFVVIFPFDRTVTGFRLYTQDGALLTSVDLEPQLDSFFASYPGDPDNPATYGSKAPPVADIPGAAIPDPGKKASDQLLGLQAIGSGALLLLGGGFASVRFLQKRHKRILIVDDNRDIIDVIAGMLKRSGYVSRMATSGMECLKELESAAPDLVLLDIGMEPMDGWETLRQIKKNPKTKGLPVIMLTARKLVPKDVEDYGVFIEDYVVKPVTLQTLNDAITHVFMREQRIKEKIAAARGAGIDGEKLSECARLTRVVDVNRRLWDRLVKTYNQETWAVQGAENEITHAIKNIEDTLRAQESRLRQIRRTMGSGVKH